MADLTNIRCVHIVRSECDGYSTDLSFTFIAEDGRSIAVDGVCVSPDIFQVKAHTLAKILAATLELPRTLDFGFQTGEGRHVHFTFRAAANGAVVLNCVARADAPPSVEELEFEVRDTAVMARLLTAFRYLDATPGERYVWDLRTDPGPPSPAD